VTPDGDAVAIYTTSADSPYGYGMVRVDRNSNLVWKFADHIHHDFDVRPDGSVHAVAHDFRFTATDPIPGFPQLPRQVLTDDLVHVSADGEELARMSLLDALLDSEYRSVLEMVYPETENPASGETEWDPLHTNTVNVIGPDFAEHHNFAEPGQLLVSFRGLDAIALADMSDKSIVWLSRGFWSNQHDPDPLPNGNILVFDNDGYGGPGGPSRLVEYAPGSNEIVWSYTGTRPRPFWSDRRGSQQPLPSGNVLVTSSQAGRLLEVDRAGNLVWDFYHPELRHRDDTSFRPAVCSAQRIEAETLTFRPRDHQPPEPNGPDAP